jgi:gluconate kinase
MNQSTQRVIKNKLGVLNLARELNNIAKACRMMGMSRDTFYRYQAAVEAGGLEALLDTNRRKPNPKNRIDELTEEAVVAHAIECPANGQKRASNELRKAGIFVSPGGVRCIWLRHNLETFKKRLKALEAKIAADGIILTESQMAALERKQEDDVACGEIETHHPGYLGSQDTFYVGHFKGVGRIYQQTYVDTYAKVAFCKLYTNKTPITIAICNCNIARIQTPEHGTKQTMFAVALALVGSHRRIQQGPGTQTNHPDNPRNRKAQPRSLVALLRVDRLIGDSIRHRDGRPINQLQPASPPMPLHRRPLCHQPARVLRQARYHRHR